MEKFFVKIRFCVIFSSHCALKSNSNLKIRPETNQRMTSIEVNIICVIHSVLVAFQV